jgi:hypothetical protein
LEIGWGHSTGPLDLNLVNFPLKRSFLFIALNGEIALCPVSLEVKGNISISMDLEEGGEVTR